MAAAAAEARVEVDDGAMAAAVEFIATLLVDGIVMGGRGGVSVKLGDYSIGAVSFLMLVARFNDG